MANAKKEVGEQSEPSAIGEPEASQLLSFTFEGQTGGRQFFRFRMPTIHLVKLRPSAVIINEVLK